MAKIVLAHGFLGFGSDGETLISYFNGIYQAFKDLGHEVTTPPVAPLGTIEDRSKMLEKRITDKWGVLNEPIYMIGHSMGGLDCRRVIARQGDVGKRVRRLITICTPHFGSPVADAVLNTADPLRAFIPAWLIAAFEGDAGALKDLKAHPTLQDLDVGGVDYLNIGADSSQMLLPSALFALGAKIGHITGQANDGVVTLKSAARNNDPLDAIWPVDHGGAVGWPSDPLGGAAVIASLTPPVRHIRRYVDLLGPLLKP